MGVQIITKTYALDQLETERKVSVVLPPGYDTSDDRYPVIYLQDGQNLYDPEAPFGNWRVPTCSEKLAKAKRPVIFVAIYHGGKNRLVEFSPRMPWTRKEARGFEYLQWVAKTLKPQIDKSYRTLPHRNDTGIGGSSMGGLISLFAASIYPEIFSKYLIFSPSLWYRPSFMRNETLYLKLSDCSVYLYAGDNESRSLVDNISNLNDLFSARSKRERMRVKLSLRKNATHSERYWADELYKAMKWLYDDHPHNKK